MLYYYNVSGLSGNFIFSDFILLVRNYEAFCFSETFVVESDCGKYECFFLIIR